MSTLSTLDVTTSLASVVDVHLKCHLVFEAFDGFVSLDALVTLLADRGLVGDVGSVHGVDLVRLVSTLWTRPHVMNIDRNPVIENKCDVKC
jgi:hypothetical protein